ncbi:unnamed protein product [Allacma fusca]|nr:unnamed protein product [Allacma fusca]
MSKTHGRGRVDKSGHNHGYYNRNSTGEEKRPSVFDRLGTRRENTSSGSHYPTTETPAGAYKSKRDPLKSHVHTHRQGHSSTKRGQEGGHTRSRSRSGSPRMKKKAVQSGVPHRSKSKGPIKAIGSREKEKTSGRKTSPKRVGSSKSKGKSLQSSKSRNNNRSSVKKSNAAKGKGKIRSSSLSSEESTSRESTSTSSTHTRTTSSTATEASSTSSTAISSTTESSVPSIKLKPAKKEKQKKKMKKKSRMSTSGDKSRHSDVPLKRPSMSSSVSSRDSRKDAPHHYKDVSRNKPSSGNWHKSPSRGSAYEGRSFSKERRSTAREKEQPSGRNFEHVPRTKDRPPMDDDSRKRRLSDDAYGGSTDGNYLGHKRSRTVPSPPPKYNKANLGRRSRSPSPRRIPPDTSTMGHKFMPRRERTPPRRSTSKERERLRIIRSPHRRPSFEEHHRRPDPARKERPHASTYGTKVVKEIERDRERPFGHAPQHGGPSNYDKPGYPQRDTSRPRDRYAPARPISAMDRGRIAPKHIEPERERVPLLSKDRLKDYESRPNRPPPLLGSAPTSNKPGLASKPNPPIRISHEDNRPRSGNVIGPKRHPPMIVKTKEALLERYVEQTIKQSRVDMWVDQTLQGSTRISVEPIESDKLPTKRLGDETRTPTPDESKDKCSSIGSMSGINMVESTSKIDVETTEKNLELSDFSDDADDILTQEVKQPPSVKSSSSVKDNQDDISSVPVEAVVNEIARTVEEVVNTDTEKDSPPTEVSIPPIPPRIPFDLRDTRSLQSQSQTDDDLLDPLDFEEISDDELYEVENKISIVDVFGVNWASLLSRDKPELPSNQSGVNSCESTSKNVRQRWTPLQVFQQVGISRKLCGEALFQKVVDKVKESLKISDNEDPKESENIELELEKPMCRRRRLERHSLLENYGLGPHSRALSAKRDMVVRRCLLNLPPKNLVSLEFGNQSSGPINTPQEPEFATDLLKLSVTHYKNS